MSDQKLLLGGKLATIRPATVENVEDVLEDIMKHLSESETNFELNRKGKDPTHGYMDMYEMFLNPESKLGCYLSVKVPSDYRTPSHALHISTRYMLDPENDISVNVYPKQKEGMGHFWSKSIPRQESEAGDAGWWDSAEEYAKDGMQVCVREYGKEGKDIDEIMEEYDYEGIPIFLNNVKKGNSWKGRCTTPYWDKRKQKMVNEWAKKDTCRTGTGINIYDPNGLTYYVNFYKSDVDNYKDVKRGNIFFIPKDLCDRKASKSTNKAYMACDVRESLPNI